MLNHQPIYRAKRKVTKMSQGKKKITTEKILATDDKILVCTGSLIKPAHFQKTLTTNYKISVHTSTYRYSRQFEKNYSSKLITYKQ